jgi:hypothetical protein
MRIFAIGVLVCAFVAAAAAFGAKHGDVLEATTPSAADPESIPTTRAGLEARFGAPVTIAHTSEGECWNYGKHHSSAPDSLQVCFRSDGGTSFSYMARETATSSDEVFGFTRP